MEEEEIRRWSWRRMEFAGAAAIGVTVMCLLIGQTAEQFAEQVSPPQMVSVQAQPQFNALDYAATGSVKGSPVVIGPCGDHKP